MSNSNDSSEGASRARRGSFTTQTFNNIFARSNSTSGGPTSPFAGSITNAAASDQRRRMSISTLGLSGTSPSQVSPFGFTATARRGSVSTANSDSIDENAIDDDDASGRSNPTTPFTRRMSFGAQALRSARGSSGSPGEGSGFNWSEQLRSRAESTVSQSHRPSFSSIAPTTRPMPTHERSRSVTDLPVPPAQVPAPAPPRPERRKPDPFQERILKGDFYMD